MRVGTKVVCINNDDFKRKLKLGETYKIDAIDKTGTKTFIRVGGCLEYFEFKFFKLAKDVEVTAYKPKPTPTPRLRKVYSPPVDFSSMRTNETVIRDKTGFEFVVLGLCDNDQHIFGIKNQYGPHLRSLHISGLHNPNFGYKYWNPEFGYHIVSGVKTKNWKLCYPK